MDKPAKETAGSSRFALFFEKPLVRAAFGLLGLLMAYVFASWAIDSGSLLDYAITILLIIFGIRELIGALRAWKQ